MIEQNKNIPNQLDSISIEIDGTLKKGGLPLSKLNVKDVFSANEKEFVQNRGQRFGRTTYSGANYTASTSDYLVSLTSLAIAPSIGLPRPSLVGTGKTYIIKDEAGGATTTNITIRSEGEKLIDGSSSTTLSTNYQVKRFYSDGSNWFTC